MQERYYVPAVGWWHFIGTVYVERWHLKDSIAITFVHFCQITKFPLGNLEGVMNPNHTRDINKNTPIFLSFELNWDFTHTTPLPPPPCTNWVRLLCRNTLTLCKSLGLIGLNVKIYSRNILHQPTWYFPPWSSHTRTSALSHKKMDISEI